MNFYTKTKIPIEKLFEETLFKDAFKFKVARSNFMGKIQSIFNRNQRIREFRVRVIKFIMQISLMFKLVMKIHHIDQQNQAAWLESDFSVSCALYTANLLNMNNGPFS